MPHQTQPVDAGDYNLQVIQFVNTSDSDSDYVHAIPLPSSTTANMSQPVDADNDGAQAVQSLSSTTANMSQSVDADSSDNVQAVPPPSPTNANMSQPVDAGDGAQAAVQYADAPARTGLFLLYIGQQQLSSLCHSAAQIRCLAMPGSDILVNGRRLNRLQVNPVRTSIVNALLIQRAGVDCNQTPCDPCRRRGLHRTVFPECIRIVGEWGSCCGNCKVSDRGTWCTWGPEDDNDSDWVI